MTYMLGVGLVLGSSLEAQAQWQTCGATGDYCLTSGKAGVGTLGPNTKLNLQNGYFGQQSGSFTFGGGGTGGNVPPNYFLSDQMSGNLNFLLGVGRRSWGPGVIINNGDPIGGVGLFGTGTDGSTVTLGAAMEGVSETDAWGNGTQTATGLRFLVRPSGNNRDYATLSEAARMTSNGRVGIGTTSPNNRFEVMNGNAKIDGEGIGLVVDAGPTTKRFGLMKYPGWHPAIVAGNSSYIQIGHRTDTDDVTTPLPPGALRQEIVVDPTGNVGIGTGGPMAKLDVNGNVNVTGNIAAKYQDVAEWVPSLQALEAGTVVVLDETEANHVIPSSHAYDTKVAGVVSAQPGLLLGEGGDGKVKVATTGRVKVKADARQRAIRTGDLLVTGPEPGTAVASEPIDVNGRRIHQPGTILGKALEPLAEGTGNILVLLTLQ